MNKIKCPKCDSENILKDDNNDKFCEDCKYYKLDDSWTSIYGGHRPYIEYCKHPDNIIIENNYKTSRKICVKSPKDINHDNCCPWYKRKGLWDKICS